MYSNNNIIRSFTPISDTYVSHDADSSSILRTATCVLSFMLMGTGSVYGLDNKEAWSSHLRSRTALVLNATDTSHTITNHVDLRTAADHLRNIRAVMNPAISDLASTFSVSRQAVYKWLADESKPESENETRIVALSQVADSFAKADILRSSSLIKMKVFEGRSLLDLVKTGENWHEAVSVLIAESQAMEAAYTRSGIDKSKSKSTTDWLSSQSIPASREEV